MPQTADHRPTPNASGRTAKRPDAGNQGSKKSLRNSVAFNLLCVLACLAAIIMLTLGGLRIYTRHGQEIEVPDLKGMTTEQAVSTLDKAGRQAWIDDSVYFKQLPPNTVYAQSIMAGSKVKEGRTIRLTINTAQPPTVPLPDIADNSSEREATMRLTALGLKLTAPEYIKGEKDWVYGVKVEGRNVAAGARIPSTASVTLVVGDGTYYDEDVEQIQGLSTDDSLQIIDDTPEEEFSPSSHSPVNASSAY